MRKVSSQGTATSNCQWPFWHVFLLGIALLTKHASTRSRKSLPGLCLRTKIQNCNETDGHFFCSQFYFMAWRIIWESGRSPAYKETKDSAPSYALDGEANRRSCAHETFLVVVYVFFFFFFWITQLSIPSARSNPTKNKNSTKKLNRNNIIITLSI